MPFIDDPTLKINDESSISLGPIALREPKKEPARTSPNFFTEVIPAAFRRENVIGSYLSQPDVMTSVRGLAQAMAVGDVDPNYDPIQHLEDRYKPHAHMFASARNADDVAKIKAKIDQEEQDLETIDRGGVGGVIAGLTAGILDPTVLVPGVAVWKAGRAGSLAARLFESAQIYGTAGVLGAGAQELGLQATQLTRTWEESALNVAGAGVLGGLLGGVAGKFGGRAVFTGIAAAAAAGLAAEEIGGDPLLYGILGAAAGIALGRRGRAFRISLARPGEAPRDTAARLSKNIERELAVEPDAIPDAIDAGSITISRETAGRFRVKTPEPTVGRAQEIPARVSFDESVPLTPRPATALERIVADIRDRVARRPDTPTVETPPKLTNVPEDFKPSPEELRQARDILRGDVPDKTPERIIQAVKRLGGVHPENPLAADLKQAGITARTAPGLYRRTAPKNMDASLREGLVESGFFTGRSAEAMSGGDTGITPADIVAAMVRDHGGEPVVADHGRLLQRNALQDVQSFLADEVGLPLANMDARELAYVLKQDPGFQRLAALDRAVDAVDETTSLEQASMIARQIDEARLAELDELQRLEGFEADLEANVKLEDITGAASVLADMKTEDIPAAVNDLVDAIPEQTFVDAEYTVRRAILDDDIRESAGAAGSDRGTDTSNSQPAGENVTGATAVPDQATAAPAGEAPRLIATRVADQLEAAGVEPEVAKDLAALHKTFAANERYFSEHGTSAAEFYQRIMGLEIRAGEAGGPALPGARVLEQKEKPQGDGALAKYDRTTTLNPVRVIGGFEDTPRILYQTAFHGSPHVFDLFSTEKIGTGMGTQRHGWGLEFSEVREIGEHYRVTAEGRTFQVDLAPKAEEYLVWEKPFEQQSGIVQTAARAILRDHPKQAAFIEKPGIVGEGIYNAMVEATGSPKAASLALLEHGVRGNKYLEEVSAGRGQTRHNYVIFDDADITIQSFWQQGEAGVPRGQIALTPGRTVISLFESANRSTFLHESGHFFLASLERLDGLDNAAAKADLAAVRNWLGEAEGAISNAGQEKFARGFETWLMEGKAPTEELAGAFRRFAEWLLQIYRHVRALNVDVPDEIRGVFARMLGADDTSQAHLDALVHHPVRPRGSLEPTMQRAGYASTVFDQFELVKPVANDLGDLSDVIGGGSVGAQLLTHSGVLGALDRTLGLEKLFGGGAGQVRRQVIADGVELKGKAGSAVDLARQAIVIQHGDPVKAADMLEELQSTGSAPRTADAAIQRLRSIGEARIVENLSRLKGAEWVGKLLANPIVRSITSPSPSTRDIAAKLVETPTFFEGNTFGVASPEAVESLIGVWKAGLGAANQKTNERFLQHRQASSVTLTQARDIASSPQGKMTFRQFREAIGEAMRRGDRSNVQEVSEAAKIWRETVFDPLKEEAIRLDLLPADVEVKTALSYLTRAYNTEKIIAQRNEWIDTAIMPWLHNQRAGAQQRLADFDRANPTPDPKALEDRDAIAELAGATDQDLRWVSEQITDTILGYADGRIPYEQFKIRVGPRGPLRERTFNIPDRIIEPWLESDIELVGSFYLRTMAADIEITRAFGDPHMESALQKIHDDYQALGQRARNEQDQVNLDHRRRQDIKDIEMFRDRLRGTYEMPADPRSVFHRAIRVTKQVNYLRLLGGMTLSAIPDIGRIMSAQGARLFFGVALDALIPAVKGSLRRAVKDEIKLSGQAWEVVLNNRARALGELGDRYGRGNRFERSLNATSDTFSLVTLMAPWNDRLKSWTGMVTMSRMLKVARNFVEIGRIGYNDVRRFAQMGLDRDIIRRIGQQFIAHGEQDGSLYWANTQAWSDLDAVRRFRTTLNKEIDRIIVTPGVGDLPGWFTKPETSLIGQFRSFTVASAQRMLLSGVQQRDLAFLNGTLLTLALGALVYASKQYVADRDISDDPLVWMTEAVDRSGLTGWFYDVHNILEKATGGAVGVNRLIGGPPVSRFASRGAVGSILGPTLGTLDEIVRATTGLSGITREGGQFRKADLRAMRRLLPFQNLFYLRWLFNRAQDGLAQELNLPGK